MFYLQNGHKGEPMDLREALYIVNIDKQNGISNAAKHLGVAQSSLSRCLQNIEQELGEPLFIRTNGNYSPTFIGTQYLSYAEQMLRLQHDWKLECRKIKNQDYGSLTISIPLVHSINIMTEVLPKFHVKFPHILVNLREESKWIDLDEIADKTIDLGIYTTNKTSELLTFETLGRDEILLAVPKGHKIKREAFQVEHCTFPSLEVEQILNTPIIMLTTDQLTGSYMEDYFLETHISPSVAMTTRSHEVALDLINKDLGFTFMPRSYASYYSKSTPIDLYHFHQPSKPLALVAAYRKDEELPESTRYLLDLVHNFVEGITDTWDEKDDFII